MVVISQQIREFRKSSSWIRKMFESGIELKRKYGVDKVCDFSLGNPDLMPPDEFQYFLEEESKKTGPFLHGYMPNAGYVETREAVAESLRKEIGVDFTRDDVVMTCGAAGAMNVVLKSILNPGESVVILSPYFVEYKFYVLNHNGKIVVSETDERFLPDIADLESRIDGNTRAVIMNTPNNPTGRVYDGAILKQVGELLREKSKKYGKPIFLISDEPYRKIVFSDSKYFAPVKFYENTVIVTSFSKDLSIPGERIGYIAVNPAMENKEELIGACIFCNRILGFINAPALMQRVVRNVIEFSVDVEVYEKRRNLLFESLRDMGYDIVKPEGTFYMFPRSPIDDDVEFSKVLQEELVLVTPGVGFGRAGYFRISFCVDEKVIEKSLERFERAIRKIR